MNVYSSWVFCPFALTASANSIRRRIASEREGLSFCFLAQLSMRPSPVKAVVACTVEHRPRHHEQTWICVPRSIPPTCVESISASNASCSCVELFCSWAFVTVDLLPCVRKFMIYCMAKLTRKQIKELAKSIIASNPGGIRFSSLVDQILQQNPETPENKNSWKRKGSRKAISAGSRKAKPWALYPYWKKRK